MTTAEWLECLLGTEADVSAPKVADPSTIRWGGWKWGQLAFVAPPPLVGPPMLTMISPNGKLIYPFTEAVPIFWGPTSRQ